MSKKKFTHFYTSDGRLWIVENHEEPEPKWTPKEKAFARKTLILGWVVVTAVGGLIGIYIGYILKGA